MSDQPDALIKAIEAAMRGGQFSPDRARFSPTDFATDMVAALDDAGYQLEIVRKRKPRVDNPPIPGHHLLNEGHVHQLRNGPFGGQTTGWSGGCQCGARPEDFSTISVNGMKRWHREHKAALRTENWPLTSVPGVKVREFTDAEMEAMG